MTQRLESEAKVLSHADHEQLDRTSLAQHLSREANERIRVLPNRPPAVFDLFVCECRLDECKATVSLTEDEYSAVREFRGASIR